MLFRSSLSGFRYSKAKATLWFGPKPKADKFKTFLSVATGYGTIELSKKSLAIKLIEGKLHVDVLYLRIGAKTRKMSWGVVVRPGRKSVLRNCVPG